MRRRVMEYDKVDWGKAAVGDVVCFNRILTYKKYAEFNVADRPIGVIYYIDDYIRICSMNDREGLYVYGGSSVISGCFTTDAFNIAEVDMNGLPNSDAIYLNLGQSGAAEYACRTYVAPGDITRRWYLPSCGELKQMFINRTIVNRSLLKAMGNGLASGGDYYISSTQYSASLCFYVGSYNLHTANATKGSPGGRVRPVFNFIKQLTSGNL